MACFYDSWMMHSHQMVTVIKIHELMASRDNKARIKGHRVEVTHVSLIEQLTSWITVFILRCVLPFARETTRSGDSRGR